MKCSVAYHIYWYNKKFFKRKNIIIGNLVFWLNPVCKYDTLYGDQI